MNHEEIADGFFFLQADARYKLSQLLTRPIHSSPELGEILIGLDSESRQHLLIPVSETSKVPSLPLGGALVLDGRDVPEDSGVRRFADLICTEQFLSVVFETLCADVVARLEEVPKKPLNTLVATLADWRSLFSGKLSNLSRESLLGLIGELEVLSILARREPVSALESWLGPTGALRDFQAADAAIEVKTSSSQDGKKVTISSLNQLDPATVSELYLGVVHVRADDSGPTVDDRVRALIKLNVPAGPLISKIAQYGHAYGATTSEPTTYATESIRFWKVTAESPGLRRSEIQESRLLGVEGVKYDLLLDALGSNLDESEQEKLEKRFVWDE